MKRNLIIVLALFLVGSIAAGAAGTAQPWRGKVTAFAAEHFKNPAWGFSHSKRDYALARSLAATDHVMLDDDVLFAAAYLHDMAMFEPWTDSKKEHGDAAADKIDIVLAGTDFPMAKKNAVRAAIRTHMFNFVPVSPEARYLHDADALDWLGAVGVARILALDGSERAGPQSVKDIESNVRLARPGLVTPAGKAQEAPRMAEEKNFLAALRRETGNFSSF